MALDPPLYGAGGGTCQLNCFGCVLQESYGRNLLLVLFTFENDPDSFTRESYFVRWFHAPFVVEQVRVSATVFVAQVVNVHGNEVVPTVTENDPLVFLDCFFDPVPVVGWGNNSDVLSIANHVRSITKPMKSATFFIQKNYALVRNRR